MHFARKLVIFTIKILGLAFSDCVVFMGIYIVFGYISDFTS